MALAVSKRRAGENSNTHDSIHINGGQVCDLNSIVAVEAAFESTLRAEAELEARLERLTSQNVTSERGRAASLLALGQRAAAVKDDSTELVSLLEGSARKGVAVSMHVRVSDQALRNGREIMSRVAGILQVRRCAEGSKASMLNGDLRAAVDYVGTYLGLGEGIKEDESSLPARAIIESVLKELTGSIRLKVKEAEDKEGGGIADMLEAISMFARLGLKEEGLDRFATWLKTKIALESERDVRSLLMESKKGDGGVEEPHIVALTRLYESVAGTLHELENDFNATFTSEDFTKLTSELMWQCDVQAQKILTRYTEARSLDDLIRATTAGMANVQDLGALLGELVLVSQRTSAFCAFIVAKCFSAKRAPLHASTPIPGGGGTSATKAACSRERANGRDVNDSAPPAGIDGSQLIASSALSKWSDEFASKYLVIESYVMERNSSKAITIDEWQPPSSLTSTAVDDIFFVLQESVQRAMAYGANTEVTTTLLRRVNFCLTGQLLPHVRSRLREAQGAAFGPSSSVTTNVESNKLFSSVSYIAELAKANISLTSDDATSSGQQNRDDAVAGKYDIYVALNNASLSGDYASRLRADIEKRATEKYGSVRDQKDIGECLEQIGETSRLLKQVADGGLTRLVENLTGPLQGALDKRTESLSYVIDETAYDDTGFAGFVTGKLENQILRVELEKRLTEENWDAIVRKVAESVADMIEAGVFLGRGNVRFNALGGLKADREVRQLSGWFAARSKRAAVRDLFVRLTQCAMVVGLEKLGEIHDIWNTGSGVTWRLTAIEVKKLLSKRVDFRQDSVRSLRL